MRRPIIAALALVAAVACAPQAPAEGPVATVAKAIALLQAKDVDGLRALACEGQEDAIRDQLGLPGAVGSELLPGVDVEGLVDAVQLDTSDLEIGEPTIEGDVAQVPVSGDLKVTFDAERVKPIIGPALHDQGRGMTDDELDTLLEALEAYGQSIPVDQSIPLVREDGEWKVCRVDDPLR